MVNFTLRYTKNNDFLNILLLLSPQSAIFRDFLCFPFCTQFLWFFCVFRIAKNLPLYTIHGIAKVKWIWLYCDTAMQYFAVGCAVCQQKLPQCNASVEYEWTLRENRTLNQKRAYFVN